MGLNPFTKRESERLSPGILQMLERGKGASRRKRNIHWSRKKKSNIPEAKRRGHFSKRRKWLPVSRIRWDEVLRLICQAENVDYLDEICFNGSMPDSEKCLVCPREPSGSENTDPLGTYCLIYVTSVWFFINCI